MGAKSWRKIPIGGVVLEPGSSIEYETGAWRSLRPILDLEKCRHCMICWVYCPDGAVQVKKSKVTGINLRYCKGCGICAKECPAGAIKIEEEAKLRE